MKDPTCQDSIGVLRHRCCRFNQHKDAIPSACSAKALFSVFPHRLSPDRALCLPTFSHLLIVNNLLSLSPLSLSLTLKRRLTYRPSVIYLIVNKLLSLSLSRPSTRRLRPHPSSTHHIPTSLPSLRLGSSPRTHDTPNPWLEPYQLRPCPRCPPATLGDEIHVIFACPHHTP